MVGDALEVDRVLEGKKFDAVLIYWSSILGYYVDSEADLRTLTAVRRLVEGNGLLFILQTASLDLTSLRSSLCGSGGFLSEIDEELTLVEWPRFHADKGVVENRWVFYRREGKDLKYIDELSFTMRVYALNELVELAERVGWRFIKAFSSLRSLEPYKPGLSPLNVVFKAA